MPVLYRRTDRQTRSCGQGDRETLPSLHFETPANTHVSSCHVVGALLGAVGPVHSLSRLTEQTILPSAQEVVPIVAKLYTAPTWPAFEDNIAFCRILERLD